MGEKMKEAVMRYSPRTALGRRLSKIRTRIIASGESLLDWDDLEIEIADRRGEKHKRNDGETGLC